MCSECGRVGRRIRSSFYSPSKHHSSDSTSAAVFGRDAHKKGFRGLSFFLCFFFDEIGRLKRSWLLLWLRVLLFALWMWILRLCSPTWRGPLFFDFRVFLKEMLKTIFHWGVHCSDAEGSRRPALAKGRVQGLILLLFFVFCFSLHVFLWLFVVFSCVFLFFFTGGGADVRGRRSELQKSCGFLCHFCTSVRRSRSFFSFWFFFRYESWAEAAFSLALLQEDDNESSARYFFDKCADCWCTCVFLFFLFFLFLLFFLSHFSAAQAISLKSSRVDSFWDRVSDLKIKSQICCPEKKRKSFFYGCVRLCVVIFVVLCLISSLLRYACLSVHSSLAMSPNFLFEYGDCCRIAGLSSFFNHWATLISPLSAVENCGTSLTSDELVVLAASETFLFFFALSARNSSFMKDVGNRPLLWIWSEDFPCGIE